MAQLRLAVRPLACVDAHISRRKFVVIVPSLCQRFFPPIILNDTQSWPPPRAGRRPPRAVKRRRAIGAFPDVFLFLLRY